MITDYKNFCKLFHRSTGIPITYHHFPSNHSESFPHILSDPSLFKGTLPCFECLEKNPDYFISRSFSYFGQVISSDKAYSIIIGPIISTPLSEITLYNFMKEWAINLKYKNDITTFLSTLPHLSFDQFIYTLAYIHLCINDKSLNVRLHFNLDNIKNTNQLSTLHSNQLYQTKESQHFHNTYHFERKMMQYVEDGNTEKLEALLQTNPNLSEGVVADNALRQAKNIMITSSALATRSAIAGGLDVEQAYQLSDVYIQECEKSQDIAYVSNLTYKMLMDFTKRVFQNKIPKDMTPEIFDCIQFISNHVNEAIQVSDVVNHVGKSRSYLTNKFKNELGFDISSFIMRCKLEEAKSLLSYSDKPLSEISNYLCFSSQSYFQNVFKKKCGMTPKQYRNMSRRI